MWVVSTWKECKGRSSSSSSDSSGDAGSSGMVDVWETKESVWECEFVCEREAGKRACLAPRRTGDDCGRLYALFHADADPAEAETAVRSLGRETDAEEPM